jgi:outer membrane receptor protein involved in Fe transport
MRSSTIRHSVLVCAAIVIGSARILLGGTTGKIAGTVTDRESGKPLPGVNVVVDGTALGASADLDGNYTILQVPPGTYSVSYRVIGYAKVTVNDVRVNIDQTAPVDVGLKVEAIAGETVVITAERKVVQKDVSSSVATVTGAEMVSLPVTSVREVVGLQAGIQGMDIRGSGADKMLLMVDGVTMRDPRNNQPVSNLPLSAVQEVSIERGGFNAEYGQVQSGIVNIVTKEGGIKGYQASATVNYAEPGPKYFGISPFDRNSLWVRPFVDDAVCWQGTKKGWNKYQSSQYPDFVGWNEISRLLMTNDNPNDDLSPAAAQRVWLWEHRKKPNTTDSDYDVDAGFGGPVPVIGKALGNLRFFSSYRRHREMLLVPLTRDDYLEQDFSLRMNSDISKTMKLKFSAMAGKQNTLGENWNQGSYLRSPESIAGEISDRENHFFGSGQYSPADIGYKSFSAELTHMVSPKTFYHASIEHMRRDYNVRRAALFDTTRDNEILPGYFVDDAPLGYIEGYRNGITGMFIGGHASQARDFSRISSTTGKFDFTSQVNFHNQVKAGLEVVLNRLDLNYGQTNGISENYDFHVLMDNSPVRAALYAQDKMEAKGFIANLGIRLDYSNSNADWWNVGTFDPVFFTTRYNTATYTMKHSKPQFQVSPRLGISHPITENSKLYFNYGHFKQMPSYQELFRVSRNQTGTMSGFGNPDLTLAKTIAYELGYDHSIANNYLIQIAAFYKDVTDQARNKTYNGIKGISYTQVGSTGYGDIRGFELTLRKSMGRWWSGFANYTYQVSSSGHFGGEIVYEDPSQQFEYDRMTQNLYQDRPIPRPYGRVNLMLNTPSGFGPKLLGLNLLERWELNLLGNWQSGEYITWNPKDSRMTQNVKRTDWQDAQLRFGRTFAFKGVNLRLFVDVYNVFNHKYMSMLTFYDYQDQVNYMNSLHLPKSKAYDNIPGDDKYGDYRRNGVDYQPVIWQASVDRSGFVGDAGVIYYDNVTREYLEYAGGAWSKVESGRMDKIMKDKAYIDMPNESSFWFLNPRQIFFGAKVSFNL